MRAALVLLLLVAASAAAAGQQEALPKVVVEVTPFPSPIAPLAGVNTTVVHVTVDCALLLGAPPGQSAQIDLAVTEAPKWAAVTVSPPTLFLAASDCQGTSLTAEAALLVSVTADSPSFTPAEVRVVVTVRTPTAETAETTTLIQAAYFSILDAGASATIFTTPPGFAVDCPLTVTNLGNGNTRVTFALLQKPDGWNVREPPAVTLESKQMGGRSTSVDVATSVLPPSGGPGTNEVGAITLGLTSAYALDASILGDSTVHSCLVTSKGSLQAPLAWAVAPLAFFVAAAFVRRR